MMKDILIIDDEPGIRSTLASILEDEKYHVQTAEDAIQGLKLLEDARFGLVFLDVWLPRMGGMEALEKIREAYPDVEVIIISGHANVDMAVRAVKLGAFDFLEKPLSLERVLTLTRNAFEIHALRKENAVLKRKAPAWDILGDSPKIRAVRTLIEQAAESDARILVTGENGTGKELVARAIHERSGRRDMPFIEVNCAAIPDTLIESELFGHEKGAFTDAVSGRKGRFELASGGTLFLDEIGDMSLNAQAKVLRALQEQQIERVGGERVINIDVRVVAATNKDLQAACKDGSFREDLFFRLNVIPIQLPPLRERGDDIPMLLDYFLKQLGYPEFCCTEEAKQLLLQHTWPGNVRELKNLAERIAVMCDDDCLDAESISALMHRSQSERISSPRADSIEKALNAGIPEEFLGLELNAARDLFEKRFIEYKLSQNGCTISKAAEDMGLYPSNLHAKIRKHGIQVER
jgi:two-component system, NtrC family, nitrogen regulation response regulator NtrX